MTVRCGTVVFTLCVAALLTATGAAAGQEPTQAPKTKPIEVTVYPILIEAPLFGASINLPSVPSRPGGGDDGGESAAQSGSTDVALNAAYMAGIEVRARYWFGEMRGQWAALSASRTTPRVALDTNTYFFSGKGGVRLFEGLFATVGFRRVSTTVDATLTLERLDRLIEGSAKPVLWDPLIGADWRRPMGRWTLETTFEGGGFGVGTDVDVSAAAHVNWRFMPHTALRLGYSMFYYKLTLADVSIGSFQRTLTSSQSLHGPELGLGIVF